MVGSKTCSSQRTATTDSGRGRGWKAPNWRMSLSRRRAWFSCVRRPVSAASRGPWKPFSTTRGVSRRREPVASELTSSSTTSKPSSFTRAMRWATRKRSSGPKVSVLVTSVHSRR